MITTFSGIVRGAEETDQGAVITLAAAIDSVLVREETAILQADGRPATLAHIRPGMRIKVSGRDDGTSCLWAQGVVIVAAPPAPDAAPGRSPGPAPGWRAAWRRFVSWWGTVRRQCVGERGG